MSAEAWAIGVMRGAAQAAAAPVGDLDFALIAEVYEEAASVMESLYGPHFDVFATVAMGAA